MAMGPTIQRMLRIWKRFSWPAKAIVGAFLLLALYYSYYLLTYDYTYPFKTEISSIRVGMSRSKVHQVMGAYSCEVIRKTGGSFAPIPDGYVSVREIVSNHPVPPSGDIRTIDVYRMNFFVFTRFELHIQYDKDGKVIYAVQYDSPL